MSDAYIASCSQPNFQLRGQGMLTEVHLRRQLGSSRMAVSIVWLLASVRINFSALIVQLLLHELRTCSSSISTCLHVRHDGTIVLYAPPSCYISAARTRASQMAMPELRDYHG